MRIEGVEVAGMTGTGHPIASGIPGMHGGLAAELASFVDSGNGRGGCALEIGAYALERAAGKEFVLSEAAHVLHLMLTALRDPATSDHSSEIILASLAAWAMAEDLSDEAKRNFMNLLEAAFAVLDQNGVQGDLF